MNLRFAVAVVLLGSIPVFSQAQTVPPRVAKPTMADVNNVVQGIVGDKAKLQTYCNLAKINQQMAEANAKNDSKTLQDLGAQADRLEESLGPEYENLMAGLEQVDENSDEGKAMGAALESIEKSCQ